MKKYTDEEILDWFKKFRDALMLLPIPKKFLVSLLFSTGTATWELLGKFKDLKRYRREAYVPTPPMVYSYLGIFDCVREAYPQLEKPPGEWTQEDFEQLKEIYLDLTLCTRPDILKRKYPNLPPDFLEIEAVRNLAILNRDVEQVKQAMETIEINPDLKEQLLAPVDFLKDVLPFMEFIKEEDRERYEKILEMIEEFLGGGK